MERPTERLRGGSWFCSHDGDILGREFSERATRYETGVRAAALRDGSGVLRARRHEKSGGTNDAAAGRR